MDIDIGEFDSKKCITKCTTDVQDSYEDSTFNGIDITCVKQEVDIVDTATAANTNCSPQSQFFDIYAYKNNKNVKKLKDNTINDTIRENNNICKRIDKKSTEIIKSVDLKRILGTSQENSSEEITTTKLCTLCAASDSIKNKSIAHFAKMILDFSGIDILKTNVTPIACSSCFKQLKMIDNFKKQIIYTNNLIVKSSITFKNSNDAVKEAGKTDEWKKMDVETSESENDDWFAIEIAKKPVPKVTSNARRSEAQTKSKRNLNQKSEEPSVNQEQPTESSEKGQFMCEACGNQYPSMERLKVHSDCVHGEKTHLCEVCGNIFNTGEKLRSHMRTHSGEKPFTCSYCNRKFSLKWNLFQHKRLHTNSLPYKCKLCSASYRHNCTLKRHIVRSHSAAECAESSNINYTSTDK